MEFETGREYKVWYRSTFTGETEREFIGRYDKRTGRDKQAYLFVGSRVDEGDKLVVGEEDIITTYKYAFDK